MKKKVTLNAKTDMTKQKSEFGKDELSSLSRIADHLAGKIKLPADFDEKLELRIYFERKHLK